MHLFLKLTHQDCIRLRGSPIGFGKALSVLTLDISHLALSNAFNQLYSWVISVWFLILYNIEHLEHYSLKGQITSAYVRFSGICILWFFYSVLWKAKGFCLFLPGFAILSSSGCPLSAVCLVFLFFPVLYRPSFPLWAPKVAQGLLC